MEWVEWGAEDYDGNLWQEWHAMAWAMTTAGRPAVIIIWQQRGVEVGPNYIYYFNI